MHYKISDGLSNELEVFPDINMNLKVKLKDRSLPLKIYFYYLDDSRKDLNIYYSMEETIPKDHKHNH
jgi:hypothetical protein